MTEGGIGLSKVVVGVQYLVYSAVSIQSSNSDRGIQQGSCRKGEGVKIYLK